MMYITDTPPTTLSGMLEFLEPGIENGLFDSVVYDDDTNPTEVQCYKDGNYIFRFGLSGSSWKIDVYTDAEKTPWAARGIPTLALNYAMRCTGGFCFVSASSSGSRHVLVIAKTASGKIGSFKYVMGSAPSSANFSYSIVVYPTTFGDTTALKIFSAGYKIQTNYATDCDRTIFMKVPVAGSYGSTDYFNTAFIRNVVQHYESGEQIIGDKHYGCMFYTAIVDE